MNPPNTKYKNTLINTTAATGTVSSIGANTAPSSSPSGFSFITALDVSGDVSGVEKHVPDCIRFRIETITTKENIYIDYEIGADIISMSSEGDIRVNGKQTTDDVYKDSIINKLSKHIFNRINISTLTKMRQLANVIEKQNETLNDLNDYNFKLAEKLSKYERIEDWDRIRSKDFFDETISPALTGITADTIQTRIEEVQDIIREVLLEIKSENKNEIIEKSKPRNIRKRKTPINNKP